MRTISPPINSGGARNFLNINIIINEYIYIVTFKKN